jgi:hypothetical protein
MRKATGLSRLGLGRAKERAFFEDQATWEALNRGNPAVRAYLIEAGFGPGPVGGTTATGWTLAPRRAYLALQKRLRDGLARHEIVEESGEPFQLEMFLFSVPESIPPKGQIAVVHKGREQKVRRGVWAAALLVLTVGVCGALYVAADVAVGMPGAPVDTMAQLAVRTGVLEALGQDALIEDLKARGIVAEEIDAEVMTDPEDPTVVQMRQQLQALRERQ